MAHRRDHRISALIKHKAADFFIQQQEYRFIITSAQMLDRRTLCLFYTTAQQQSADLNHIESMHQSLCEYTPALKKHIAIHTHLKFMPKIIFQLDHSTLINSTSTDI